MKNVLLLSTALLALLVTSCSKEGSFEDPTRVPGTVDSTIGGGTGGGGNNANGTQLYRVGTRMGTDSVTIDYTYNSAGVLTGYAERGTITGVTSNAEVRWVRNSANIITQSIVKSNLYAALGFDSVVTRFYYDAGNSRYTHAIIRTNTQGVDEGDSAVFAYTAGKLSSIIGYTADGSGGYEPDTKQEFTYVGANLRETKSFVYNEGSSQWELETTSTREHDSKINPVSFPVDAPVMDLKRFFSTNNFTKVVSLDAASGQSEELTNIYTYTSSNRPAKAVTSVDGVVSLQSTYYYR